MKETNKTEAAATNNGSNQQIFPGNYSVEDANIQILERFKKLIEPLTPAEHSQLEQNILDEGIRDPLVVWNGILIDGHNRYGIALKHNLSFNIVPPPEDVKTEDDVELWMLKNQLGRRNVSALKRSEMATAYEKILREKKGKGRNTRKQAAKAFNISETTHSRAKAVQKHGSEELIEKVKSGATTISAAYNEVKGKNSSNEQKKLTDDLASGELVHLNKKNRVIAMTIIGELIRDEGLTFYVATKSPSYE